MKIVLVISALLFLTGCEGGWHPIDCALGNSYSPTWCPEGTKGYENQQAGRGKSLTEAYATIAAMSGHPYQPVIVTQQPQVAQSTSIVTQISGEFHGWTGDTIYSLMDGRVIQQSEYHYHYHYAYSPKVVIYQSMSGLKIHVIDDADQDIGIRFIQ